MEDIHNKKMKKKIKINMIKQLLKIKFVKKWGLKTDLSEFVDQLICETADKVINEVSSYSGVSPHLVERLKNKWVYRD